MTALAILRQCILLVVITVGAFILLGAAGDPPETWTVLGVVATGASFIFAWFQSKTREPAVLIGALVALGVGVWRFYFGEDEALRFQEFLMLLAPLLTAWATRFFVTPTSHTP